jgi:hypothetical protein
VSKMKLKIMSLAVSGVGVCKRHGETENRVKDLLVSGWPWAGGKGTGGEGGGTTRGSQ